MKICVYGAASSEIANYFIEVGEELGRRMVQRGHSLVFGGGKNGMMGAVARGVAQKKGEIIGIAPSFFRDSGVEISFLSCTQFINTETMRERKRLLDETSDAFIISPGGIGTFDEFFEILTLKQLGRHSKAIAVFNVNGYYDSLISMMQNALDNDFIAPATLELYKVCNNCDEVIAYLEEYTEESIGIKDTKYV